MNITPSSVSIIKGMTADCYIENVPESEVLGEWQVSYSVEGKVTASVDSRHVLTLTSIAAGSTVVTVSYVIGSETITATVAVTVQDVPTFENITQDGSGTDDTTIFTRQYIINNNLKRVSTFNDSIESTINTIKTLCWVNFGATAADLALVIASLAVIKDAISNISSSAGKNTVEI